MAIDSSKITGVANAIIGKVNALITTHNSSASAHSQGSANGNKNVVTDANGNITTEAKPTIPSASSTVPSADTAGGAIGSGTTWAKADHQHPLSSAYAVSGHTHDYTKTSYSQTATSSETGAYEIGKITIDGSTTTLYGKDTNTSYTHPSSHASTMITEASALSNIGTSANATQHAINEAINTKMAEVTNIDLVKLITGDLPTASASTMNQLYVKAKTNGSGQDTYNIYVTIKSGSSYAWEKVDDFDLQTLSIAWNSITDKPSSFTPASHTHGSLTDDGKIGTASGKIITTGTGGALQASASITKSMISDFSHTHDYTTISDVDSEINQALDDLAEAIYPTTT